MRHESAREEQRIKKGARKRNKRRKTIEEEIAFVHEANEKA